MTPETDKLQQVLDTVAALRAEMSGFSRRLTALEAAAALAPAPQVPPAAADAEQLSEELVLTISAAIAAYLGVKPQIRQIRLLGSASWAQHGRATIQASHALAVPHG